MFLFIAALGCDGWSLCPEFNLRSSDCEVFKEQDQGKQPGAIN